MKNATLKMISRILIVSMMLLSFQTAQASMIGTNQVIAAANAQSDRAAVLSQLSRSEVSSQLQSLGLDPKTAQDRIAAMTDQEVSALAGKINSMPAGAISNGWGWAVAIVIAIVIFYNWK